MPKQVDWQTWIEDVRSQAEEAWSTGVLFFVAKFAGWQPAPRLLRINPRGRIRRSQRPTDDRECWLATSRLRLCVYAREGTRLLRIDALLAPVAKDTLSRIDAVYERLSSNDPEAISHALTTCRRLIDGFADQVFPPQDEARIRAGVIIDLGEQKHLNRIKAFVDDHCSSESRASRLKRRLSDLYERVNAGIHADVSPDEARFLFLDTYLSLGEILSLAETKPLAEPELDQLAAEVIGPTEPPPTD